MSNIKINNISFKLIHGYIQYVYSIPLQLFFSPSIINSTRSLKLLFLTMFWKLKRNNNDQKTTI